MSAVVAETVDTPVFDEYVTGEALSIANNLVTAYNNSFNKVSWHSLEETRAILKSRTEERLGVSYG